MEPKVKKKPEITETRMAGKDHAVHTVIGGKGDYQRQACAECPWRKSNTGSFPAEAFKHSANTAEDMATHTFACHMKGSDRPSTCAGFLLVGANDNLTVRLKRAGGDMCDVRGNIEELHESYKAMAIANGVDKDDPAIAKCMPEGRDFYERRVD